MKKYLIAIIFLFVSCSTGTTETTDPNDSATAAEEAESTDDTEENQEPRFSELLDYLEVLEFFEEGMEAEVLDIETGLTYNVQRVTGGYNTIADVETLTWEDTENLLRTAGGEWTARTRAIIVTVGDRKFAASIAPFEHSGSEAHPFGEIIDNRTGNTGTGINLDSIRGNGMVGVVDIYFFNSLIPGINRVNEMHQKMVLAAYEYEG